jgi:uncharacterized protein with FMN-binding domain
MAKKLRGRLLALSASAVATIYLAGLVSTQPAAAAVAASASPAGNTSTNASTPVSTSPVVVGGSMTSTTGAPTATYADGTYSGTGTSRFGNVSVSVTVSGGRLTNVQITNVTTSFPESRIASLPAAVVVSQSANVNVVSGATYSSSAFKQALQQALTQAQAASTTTTIQG